MNRIIVIYYVAYKEIMSVTWYITSLVIVASILNGCAAAPKLDYCLGIPEGEKQPRGVYYWKCKDNVLKAVGCVGYRDMFIQPYGEYSTGNGAWLKCLITVSPQFLGCALPVDNSNHEDLLRPDSEYTSAKGITWKCTETGLVPTSCQGPGGSKRGFNETWTDWGTDVIPTQGTIKTCQRNGIEVIGCVERSKGTAGDPVEIPLYQKRQQEIFLEHGFAKGQVTEKCLPSINGHIATVVRTQCRWRRVHLDPGKCLSFRSTKRGSMFTTITYVVECLEDAKSPGTVKELKLRKLQKGEQADECRLIELID